MPLNIFGASKLHVHYNRLNSDYEGWSLWVWNEEEKKPGFEAADYVLDDFGALFEIDLGSHSLAGKRIGILHKCGNWEMKDGGDKIVNTAKQLNVYIVEGDEKIYFSRPEVSTRVIQAVFDSENKVKVGFSRNVNAKYVEKADFLLLYCDQTYKPLAKDIENKIAYLFFPPLKDLKWENVVRGKALLKSPILPAVEIGLGDVMYGKDFGTEKRLGAFLKNGQTYIRVFSPSVRNMYVLIYDTLESWPNVVEMDYRGGGLWEKIFDSDLDGKYYKIRVKTADGFVEGLDPYARCVTAHDGKALILTRNGQVSSSPEFPPSHAIIYEMHIRDFTIDENSGIRFGGKYLGLTENETSLKAGSEIKTGLSHLRELGINVVHVLPIQDFENNEHSDSYNWGYMPVNFNSPEGWYATKTEDDSRVKELKKMISVLHENGIKVVMDVVYNHTAETDGKQYNFEALAPGYYYRKNPDGSYSNGSGCGNEFKTESEMGRKFIIDSLLYWTKRYGVDGFRFDLMGLIDKQTSYEIVRRLTEIKPDIIIYGEPWTAGRTPVEGIRKGDQKGKGFALFNDDFRDALKGNVFDINEPGYIQASLSDESVIEANKKRIKVMEGIKGSISSFTESPLESVNYVSCHDNHTIFDRMDLSLPEIPLDVKIKAAFLANAIVLTSQGIPFIHSGAEFLRSKKGESNSYNLPDEINMIRWAQKKENLKIFNLYKALIKIRKEHPVFRMENKTQIEKNLRFYEDLNLPISPPSIAYVLYGENVGDIWKKVVILINPENKEKKFILPDGDFRLVFDSRGNVERMSLEFEGEFLAQPVSLTILAI